MIDLNKKIDRIKGALFGGAIGDALGHQVEDLTIEEIHQRFGPYGVSFDLSRKDKFLVSDNTQLTLYTINGILMKLTRSYFLKEETSYLDNIHYAYLDWLNGQNEAMHYLDYPRTWLKDIKELNVRRSPNATNIEALRKLDLEHRYNLDNPINNKDDVGALIRIAPLGLVNLGDVDICIEASKIASLTHGHPLSYLSVQYYAIILHNIMKGDGRTLWRIAKDALRDLKYHYDDSKVPPPLKVFVNHIKGYVPDFVELMKNSLILVKYDMVKTVKNYRFDQTLEVIKSLGEGKNASEALAIALFYAVRYQLDPTVGVRMAVNHPGDSATIGEITGQILGAYYGESAIPLYLIKNLDLKDVIDEIAIDLANSEHLKKLNTKEQKIWKDKYIRK